MWRALGPGHVRPEVRRPTEVGEVPDFPPAGSGPSDESGAGRAPDAGRCQAPLTSPWRCARTPRGALRPARLAGAREVARAVPGDNPEAAELPAEARARRSAAGWSASRRLTRLRCAAESRAGDREGARWRLARAALPLPWPRSGSKGRAPRLTPALSSPPGAERLPPAGETPPGPRPCVARLG